MSSRPADVFGDSSCVGESLEIRKNFVTRPIIFLIYLTACLTVTNLANGESCTLFEGSAGVLSAQADGLDVVVHLGWLDPQPDTVTLEMAHSEGPVISSSSVVLTNEGSTVHRMVGVLANVPSEGFSYQLLIKDEEGVALAPAHPFQVLLQCLDGECHYRLENFVKTDTIYIPFELRQALDEIRQLGMSDIYTSALLLYPHLEGEIYTVILQLGQLNQGEALVGPCPCWWTSVKHVSTPHQYAHIDQDQDCPQGEASEKISRKHGARQYIGAQAYKALGGILTSSGKITVELELVCETIVDWIQITISILGQEEQIHFPLASSCSRECNSQIVQGLNYRARLTALAEGMPSVTPSAQASHNASYVVDDDLTYRFEGELEVTAGGAISVVDNLCEDDSVSVLSQQSKSWATLDADTRIAVQVEPISTCGGPYVFAESENAFTLFANGTSDCTDLDAELIYLDTRRWIEEGPGASLIRWRP